MKKKQENNETRKRIVSFLPSATEIIYELDEQENLHGVTHECRYPPEAIKKPKIISSVINSEVLTSKEIDTITCQLLNDKKDIFVLNEERLISAAPDLIISQEICEVCAPYTNQVQRASQILQNKPKIFSMNPHNLDEILDSVKQLGIILGKENTADQIVNSLKKRIEKIKKVENKKKPNILAIEWLDPFFTAGHWIPEMVEIAGGINMISKKEEHSKRIDFEKIKESNPDKIILMPCGFNTKRTLHEYSNILNKNKKWLSLKAVKNNQVYAVDANSFFSKPSIRTVQGLEILAKIIQPNKFEDVMVNKESFTRITHP